MAVNIKNMFAQQVTLSIDNCPYTKFIDAFVSTHTELHVTQTEVF
jgi:hypothetical protein